MIKNTSRVSELDALLMLIGGPGGIERSEAAGQRQLVTSSQLPSEGLTAEQAKARGIAIKGTSSGDPLFVDVTLPDGWKVQPTDHAMWSILLDANGVKKASIFYKAAFYDRRAFINFEND